MKFDNIKASDNYNELKIQFNALKRWAESQQAQIQVYQKRMKELSVERVIQLEAELESQIQMNAILTEEINQNKMEKILTAEEFVLKDGDGYLAGDYTPKEVYALMIEFAKLHVEAALKAKIQAMKKYHNDGYSLDEIDAFTKESYPLENIN